MQIVELHISAIVYCICLTNYKYRLLGEPSMVSLETQADGEQRKKEPGKTSGGHDQHQSTQHQWHKREKLELVRQQQRQHELLKFLEVLHLERLVLFALLFPPAFLFDDRRLLVSVTCRRPQK